MLCSSPHASWSSDPWVWGSYPWLQHNLKVPRRKWTGPSNVHQGRVKSLLSRALQGQPAPGWTKNLSKPHHHKLRQLLVHQACRAHKARLVPQPSDCLRLLEGGCHGDILTNPTTQGGVLCSNTRVGARELGLHLHPSPPWPLGRLTTNSPGNSRPGRPRLRPFLLLVPSHPLNPPAHPTPNPSNRARTTQTPSTRTPTPRTSYTCPQARKTTSIRITSTCHRPTAQADRFHTQGHRHRSQEKD